METPHSISLRRLAKIAGVSVGTASQALRETGSTSAKTRERIKRLAQELGYQPDQLMAYAGSRHRAGKKGPTELPVLFLTGRSAAERAFLPKTPYRDECKAVLQWRGFQFLEANCETIADLRRALREFYHRGGTGILLGKFERKDWLQEMDWSPFSVVQLGGDYYRPLFNVVSLNYPQAVDLAISEALTLKKRVGIVFHYHPPYQVFDDWLREGVVIGHLNMAPDSFVSPLRMSFALSFEEQAALTREWLHTHKPQVLVGFPIVNSLVLYLRHPRLPLVIPVADTLPAGCAGCTDDPYGQVIHGVNMLDGMIRRQERGLLWRPSIFTLAPHIAVRARDIVK